jgi:uroporphyrinogen III methyltransferase / synthase
VLANHAEATVTRVTQSRRVAFGDVAGIVYLVGAGPGDPGLMTRRSLDLIAAAEVILYDRLIPPGALEGAREEAELRYVGKQPGAAAIAQEELNALLVKLGAAGKRVVRLKGGDPFVFGRGGEEAEALAEAGIPFEVVPGVTAGIAAPAYAGIPVTHRDAASAVAFVTGHEHPEKPESALDWEALARFPGTLVLYMGVKNLPVIAERLIAAGRPATEPAAVVERGTHPGQRTVVAPLDQIAARVSEEGIRPPSITLIGEVASLRKRIAWLDRRPLHGQVVAVTRARAQASGLAARLRELGAEVVETPAIRIQPLPLEGALLDAVSRLRDYALVCLTSPNGVRLLFEALDQLNQDARALTGATVAAIGPGTASELAARGIRADVVPERFVAEGLIEALASLPLDGRRVLVARAAEARDVLPDALRERGGHVDEVALYQTVSEALGEEERGALERATYVTFTSSSTVRFFLASGARVPEEARVVSIGPITSATAREEGLQVDVEAEQHDLEGLVRALREDAS